MKNFTLLLSAAMLMGASASAAGLTQNSVNLQNRAKMVKVENTQKAPSFTIRNTPREFDLTKLTAQPRVMSRGAEDVIYDPEGEVKSYFATTFGWEYGWFGLTLSENTAMTEVVFGEDGAVYLKNLVDFGLDNWVKGTLKDGKIRVDFPQTIYYDAEEYEGELYEVEYDYNICRLEVYDNVDEETGEEYQTLDYVIVEPEENYAIYDYNEETGVITLELTDWEPDPDMYDDYSLLPDKIIALTVKETGYEEGWSGYGPIQQVYEPNAYSITELPEGVEPEKWCMSYYDTYGEKRAFFIQVAIDGNHMYLGGFDEMIEGWAKGRIDGNTVTFESEQYLGYIDWYQTPMFFMTGHIEEIEEEDEDGEVWITPIAHFTEGIMFKYDAEGKRLESFDPEMYIILNGNTEELYFLDMYKDPTIYVQDPALVNAAPQTPSMFYFIPWSTENYGGQGEMVWSIPSMNVNGEMLDTDRMYYHILYDGEVTPLDPDEYPMIDEEIWDIPYNFTDEYDISAGDPNHYIWFYVDGVTTYGCQSFYEGSDGVTYASEIGVYVYDETGIEGVQEFSKVLSTTYYDLSGREVVNPQAGIYIVSMKLENGKVCNGKVSIK